jgi:uncharacterized membrane protein YqjE
MAAAERPLVEVLNTIFGSVEDLVRSEVNLARAELREEIARATRGAWWLLIGAVASFLAVGFLLVGLFFALAMGVPDWAAALIIAAGLAIIAAITLRIHRSKAQSLKRWHSRLFGPQFKESMPWVKPRTK